MAAVFWGIFYSHIMKIHLRTLFDTHHKFLHFLYFFRIHKLYVDTWKWKNHNKKKILLIPWQIRKLFSVPQKSMLFISSSMTYIYTYKLFQEYSSMIYNLSRILYISLSRIFKMNGYRSWDSLSFSIVVTIHLQTHIDAHILRPLSEFYRFLKLERMGEFIVSTQ